MGGLLPLKAVADELGVSRTTFWRLRKTQVSGVPLPVLRSGMQFWRRSDLPTLEEAFTQYRGRIAFERERDWSRRIRALGVSSTRRTTRERFISRTNQLELFPELLQAPSVLSR